MTTLTKVDVKAEFLKVFNRLAVALRAQDVDAAMQRVYYEALQDLPPETVKAGAEALAKEPGRKWFPTTGEWRQAAEVALTAQLRQAIPAARRDPWTHECDPCEDTGWVLDLTCPGSQGTVTCGRVKPHAAHTYTQPCLCRPTNRTYQRHQRVGAGE
jgi:hypothetical protein